MKTELLRGSGHTLINYGEFVTRVWQHPLLDLYTDSFRNGMEKKNHQSAFV